MTLTISRAVADKGIASTYIVYHEATLIAFASKLLSGPVWVEIIRKIAALWPGL